MYCYVCINVHTVYVHSIDVYLYYVPIYSNVCISMCVLLCEITNREQTRIGDSKYCSMFNILFVTVCSNFNIIATT